jgi:hypothetical protein
LISLALGAALSVADVPPAPSPRRPYARVAAIVVTVGVANAKKGEPVSKEPMMEKSIPIPERKSIANKMIAAQCGASHAGVAEAAKVSTEMPAANAAKVSAAEAASVAATKATAVHGGCTQS